MLGAVTGWDYTAAELRLAGERIHTLKKVFNIRERWRTEDDWLPPRLIDEPLTSGIAAGARVTASELREMLRGYYDAREWDEHGFVPAAKRAALGIAEG
jgi:aldehyde:ferredoxin oxidoreductase